MPDRDEASFWRGVFESAPIGITVVGPDLRFQAVNPALGAILGYPPAELTGRAVFDLVHLDDAGAAADLAGRLFRGETPGYQIEQRLLRRDGTIVWATVGATLLRTGEDAPLALGVVVDITERRAMEAALRESEGRLAEAQQLARLGNWSYDLSTRTIIWSTEIYRIYGLDPAAGPPDAAEQATRLYPASTELVRRTAEVVLTTGSSLEYEIQARRTDGRPIVIHARIASERDATGRPVRLYGTLQDITERKAAEAERERLIAELQAALAQVRTLRGLIPICASCKKVRDDQDFWHSVESYVSQHTEATFTHGICPDCARKLLTELDDLMRPPDQT